MSTIKTIHCLVDLVAGYHAVLSAIDAVLSKTRKSQHHISVQHYAVASEVYNFFTKNTELYRNYIVGTDAHTAHTDALVEIKFFIDNPNAQAPDARARLFKAKTIIMDELLKHKNRLLEEVKSL